MDTYTVEHGVRRIEHVTESMIMMNEPREFKINSRECQCGSGHYKYALKDAAGIFCCYVCESCEEEVRKGYNPKIFDVMSRYSTTGEEEDLW